MRQHVGIAYCTKFVAEIFISRIKSGCPKFNNVQKVIPTVNHT